jgi:D-threo-aldose 1-dehydrogenase
VSEAVGRRLAGRCGLSLPVLGFGCAPLGGLYRPVAEADVAGAVEAALEHGIDFFDVAPAYGFGLAETRLGVALGGRPAILSTKVGRVLEPCGPDEAPDDIFVEPSGQRARMDYSRAGTRRSVEESLRRLGRDRLGFALVHDFTTRRDRDVPEKLFRQTVEETIAELAAMRAEGLVAGIGIGVNAVDLALRYLGETDIDAVMIAGRITLLDRSGVDTLLPACGRRGVAVLAAAPFNSGALASDRRFDYGALPTAIERRVERLRALARDFAVPLEALALQYPLRFPQVASVVVGMRSAAEVRANAGHLAVPVPDALWSAL